MAWRVPVSLSIWCQKHGGIRVVRVDVSLAADILRVFGTLIDQVNLGVV